MYSTNINPRNGRIGTTSLALRDPRTLRLGLVCLLAALFFSLPVLAQVDVQVTWNENTEPDLAGYIVYWGTQPDVYPNFQDAGLATSDIIYDLSEGTTYYIAVTAYDLAGNESAPSVWDSITADLTPPIISNINAGSITENSVTITWDTNEPATSRVQYGETVSYGSQTSLDPTLVTSHSVVINGLDSWTTYHFRVKSNDAEGNQAISGDNEFTTDDTTDPVISNIQVIDIGDNGATITWTTDEPASSRVDYGETVAYGDHVEDPALVISHSISLTGLDQDTLYHFKVRSADENGNLASSGDNTFTTTDSGAPVITDVEAIDITGDSVTIIWTTDEPATSVVHYGETAAYGSDASVGGMTTDHSMTINGLEDGTTYHYQVESTDDSDNTSTSSDRTFDTLDETAPDAPTGVEVVAVS